MSGELLPAFVDGAISLVALVIAILLFTQFRVARIPAVLALACGFLLLALTSMPQLLRAAQGALADPRLQFITNLALPMAAIAYALLRRSPADSIDARSAASLLAGGVVVTVTLAALITLFAASPGADAALPAAVLPLLLTLLSMALVWRRRGTLLDLWLLVALTGSAIGLLLRAVLAVEVGVAWHLARLFDLLGLASLMFVLLGENAALYSRLARLLAGRPGADVRERRAADTAAVVSGMADDLNQPLCAITANADAIGRLLDQERPDLAEVRAALDDIVGDARRASEALLHARRELKSTSETPVVIDVGQLVGECLSQLRPELSSRRVVCEVLTAESLPGVHGSRPQLLQVLVDLVRHSLDARPGGPPRERRLRVHASRHDAGAVAISVEDTGGPGVPPHSHPRLAFCRTVVRAHGGHLSVTPGELGGAAFKVILPASS